MSSQLRRALALSLAIAAGLLATAALALAAGAIKGAVYVGTLKGEIFTLKVSKSGKTVEIDDAFPPSYCQGGSAGVRQISNPAPISKSGSFRDTISYEFVPTKKKTSTLVITGKFSGRSVSGSAHSDYLLASSCSGTSSFKAKVQS
ncbi:MAG: hypothetical protein ABSG93_07720 [Solirubrobacteraceae bacterium]|jgi:hypothetical protein